ncbi:MAG: hypothetical protein ACKOAF_05420 [Actinomycetes bacterium]
MADSPADWLPALAARFDSQSTDVERFRSYARGNAPLPEMGPNLRASWVAFQKKARTDFGGLAIGSLADRLIPNGIQVGGASDDPRALQAQRIWRDNRCDVQVSAAIRDYLETSWGYLVSGVDSDGLAVVTRESPDHFIALTDPLRPWRATAALKVWRVHEYDVDFARVWIEGMAQTFVRPARVDGRLVAGASAGQWREYGPVEEYVGFPPVSVLDRDAPFLAPHLDIIDRINLTKLQRLVTTAMQAFRQRAVKGDLEDRDEAGNEIDWGKVFEPAPGALWEIPDGIDIWESQQTDIRPMLEAEKSDAREFAAVTRTPISVLVPEGANQSAEGAAQAKEGQIMQARQEIARISPAIEAVFVHGLRAEGADLSNATVEILWSNPAHVSLSEQYAAAAQAKAAGLPLRHILRDILSMSPQQISRVEQDAAAEQLNAALLIGSAMNGAPNAPVTG